MLNGMVSATLSTRSGGNVNFVAFTNELDEEISEVIKELSFLKKEIHILNTERDTIADMARTKCEDIDRYLNKELHYLDELVIKSQVKQKAENSRFVFQCQQVKTIANELDDDRMQLVKRVINIEDHLGIETGPLDNEQNSLSGNHADLADGKFSLQQSLNSINLRTPYNQSIPAR